MSPEGPPLRIALFHDLPSGGAKRTVHAHARELVRRGHHVEAFIPSTAAEDFLPLREVIPDVNVFDAPPPPDRERLLAGRPGPGDLIQWLKLYFGLRRTARTMAGAIDEGEFDVVIVHPSQFTQSSHLLRYARTPTLYYCQEVLRAAYEPLISPAAVRLTIRLTLGRIDRANVRAAAGIVANSDYTRQRVREVYGRTAAVVHPAVDVHAFRPRDGERDRYVLAVGALHPLKGFDFVIEALGHLPPPVRPPLMIVGDRSRERERSKIERLADENRVELTIRESVTEDELRTLYARARAVVLAPHREPFGLVPLEAMASGTPVVGVAEGGIPETVVDGVTGLLSPRDSARFAAQLRRLLEDPEEGERMGRDGRKRVEELWTWERAVDRLMGVVHEMGVAT